MLLGGNSSFQVPDVRKIINPQLNADSQTVINVVESAQNYQVFYKTADSVSSSTINFGLVVPSNVLVGRVFTLEVPFTLNLTCVASGANLAYQATRDGVRCCPFNQMLASCQLSLNGQLVSSQVGQLVYGAFQLMTDEEKALFGPAAYQDTYQNLSGNLDSNNNPLATYPVCTTSKVQTRGSLNGSSFTISANTTTGFTVTGIIREQLMLVPPLQTGPLGDSSKALAGVNDINLTLNMVNDARRFWQHIGGGATAPGAFTNMTLEFGTDTKLALEYWKPSVKYDPMEKRLYSYANMTVYTTAGGSVADGATVSISSATQALSCVPSKLLVWCRSDDTARTQATSDTFLPIQSISIEYDNRNSVLSTLSPYGIYCLSRKNGVNVPWVQWSYYTGGIACIDVAADIGTDDDQVAGTIGKHQINIVASFKNTSGATLTNVKLFVVPILPGALVIGGGTCEVLTGILTPEQAKSINAMPGDHGMYSKTLTQNSVYGSGSVFSDVWDGVKEASKIAAPHLLSMAARAALGGAQVGGKKGVRAYRPRGSGLADVESLDKINLEERLTQYE